MGKKPLTSNVTRKEEVGEKKPNFPKNEKKKQQWEF